jgi:hypothetical protein
MHSFIPPHEIYRTQMADAKLRILAVEKVLASSKPATGYAALDMEFCFLQIRRVIEAVTFGAMIREELRYIALCGIEKNANARDHGDAAKDWQAPEILKRLVSLSPHVLPIPHKDGREVSPGLIHFDQKEIEVNHARLIDLYARSGGFLHAKSPVGQDFASLVESQRKKYVAAPAEVRRALKFLRELLWQHAAVTLEPAGLDDPRIPASPKHVWLVSFGGNSGPEVTTVVAEAV